MLSNTAFDESMTWAVSGYRYLSDNFGNVYADAGGYGLATRLTAVPLASDDKHFVHLGFDYSYNDPGRDLVQYASTNEFLIGQNANLGPGGLSVLPFTGVPPFVNTGQVPTAHTNLVNLESAVSLGSLVAQSEIRWAVLEQLSGVSDTFPAAYVHVRYVLTGETIPYNRKAGVFGRVVPDRPVNLACGDWGAWEIAMRVSQIDLDGTALPGPGRRLTDTILGLSWYVNAHTKFQLNYIHSDLTDRTIGDSNIDTVAFRGQLDF
jgi:phosphate-selective porin OprO/OprP